MKKAKTQDNLRCIYCGIKFLVVRHWQEFCSDKCRVRWYGDLRAWAIDYIRSNSEASDSFGMFREEKRKKLKEKQAETPV